MNVQEQHIEINLSSQKIASNVNRNFDPSELDWILNKMVDRFIKDRIKEDKDSLGFDATEIDLDALRTIIVNDRFIPVFTQNGEQEVYADLPGDYSYLIDDASAVINNCDSRFKTASKFTSKTKNIYTYPINASTKAGSGPFYTDFTFTLNATAIITVTAGPGLRTKEELFTFKNYLLGKLWDLQISGVEFYWERYNGIYSRQSIIVVSDAVQTGNSITIDGTTTAGATSSVVRTYAPTITSRSKIVSNRLIRGQVRSNVLDSTFAGTSSESPISAITQAKLKVYYGENFIVNKLRITYVRKPSKISLSLGQDCDLAEEFHMQICDMAVLYIKELTMAPDWELKLRDNMESKN